MQECRYTKRNKENKGKKKHVGICGAYKLYMQG